MKSVPPVLMSPEGEWEFPALCGNMRNEIINAPYHPAQRTLATWEADYIPGRTGDISKDGRMEKTNKHKQKGKKMEDKLERLEKDLKV